MERRVGLLAALALLVGRAGVHPAGRGQRAGHHGGDAVWLYGGAREGMIPDARYVRVEGLDIAGADAEDILRVVESGIDKL